MTLAALHANVRAALRAAVAATSGIPPVAQREYENIRFLPQQGVEWVRESLVFQPTEPAAIGPLALTRTRFTFTLDSYFPILTGATAGDARIGALLQTLGPGRSLVYAGQTVHVESSQGKKGAPDGSGWWLVPFVVAGYADVPNVI